MTVVADLKDRISNRQNSLSVAKATLRNVVTAELHALMAREGTSRAELARKMKISKSAVTGLLSGDRNFTIDTIANLSFVLGYRPEFQFRRGATANWSLQMIHEKLVEVRDLNVQHYAGQQHFSQLHESAAHDADSD